MDFVCDSTGPTDKIRTCRDCSEMSTTRQSPRTCRRPERTRSDFVGDPGRRSGSPTKSGGARLVKFGHMTALHIMDAIAQFIPTHAAVIYNVSLAIQW